MPERNTWTTPYRDLQTTSAEMGKAEIAGEDLICAAEASIISFEPRMFRVTSSIFKSEASIRTRKAATGARCRDESLFNYTDNCSGTYAHGN